MSARRSVLRLPGACQAARAMAADDLKRVLQRLDAAAANFHSTTADFEFDTYQTDPFPDKDVQKGTAYYERKGAAFQMAAHIDEINGKAGAARIYTYSDGVLQALRADDQPGDHFQQARASTRAI